MKYDGKILDAVLALWVCIVVDELLSNYSMTYGVNFVLCFRFGFYGQ